MPEYLTSTTRFAFLIMIIALIGMNYYAMLYLTENTLTIMFTLFTNVLTGLLVAFTTKSAVEAKQNTISTNITKDIPVEKKEDIHDNEFTAGKI